MTASAAATNLAPTNAGSQSLFNVYYLGQTVVDRRCTSSIMPWIIEELKLKAEEMKFIWLSPGQYDVSFVADNGKELFRHLYGSILQCCLAMDGISFAYIARQEKDTYVCHVFQAFNYDEASKIMVHFKQHAKEEIPLHGPISDAAHAPPAPAVGDSSKTRSSAYVMSLGGSGTGGQEDGGKPPIQGDTYKLVFLGKYRIPMSVSTGSDQVEVIDMLVAKVKDTLAARNTSTTQGKLGMRRSIGSRLLGKSSKPSPPNSRKSSNTGDVDKHQGDVEATVARAKDQTGVETKVPPSRTSEDILSKSVPSSIMAEAKKRRREDGATQFRRSKEECDIASAAPRTLDFDTIPELGSLQQSVEFQALSSPTSINDMDLQSVDKDTVNARVQLNFSGVHVLAVAEENNNVLFKKSIRTIACCAQGKKEGEYLAFTSREGEHCHVCYLFVARNIRLAVKVLDSFKAAFVHALSLRMPPATCEYCPMHKIETLCKNLEGVSMQVAQSKLQETLEELSESDYSKIMQNYKVSEHADHEFTQIIVLVALLRQHFQRLQDKHAHRGIVTSKVGRKVSGRGMGGATNTTGVVGTGDDFKLKVPAIARAKMIIANSIENLRSKPSDSLDRNRKSSGSGPADKPSTQSLFAHKSSIDTLMSPVHSKSPSVDEDSNSELRLLANQGGESRSRSWTSDAAIRPPRLILDGDESDREKGVGHDPRMVNGGSSVEHTGSTSPSDDLPHIPRAQSWRGLRDSKKTAFLSLTPPSSNVNKIDFNKNHRRAVSHEIGNSWRQEIFESILTPGKAEKRQNKIRASSDILDEFEIIELNPSNSEVNQRGVWSDKPSHQEEEELESASDVAKRRWKSAIHQQILLLRMDKQNQWIKVTGRNKLKMYYDNALGDSDPTYAVWRQLLDGTSESSTIPAAILAGVPATCREEVWEWLSDQYQDIHNPSWTFPEHLRGEKAFHDLSQRATEYEHSISVDIGRTFPSHPYFSSSLQEGGQADLYRILRAYAAADQETGYCQGLSFVTGIILVHTKDEYSAFAMLYKLMNLHGYKEIYKGSLAHLQVRLYQLSRLIFDFIPSLHQLFRVHDVTPFFYAAPWFLTIFASQYSISFSARVFDLIFCEGVEVLFKVALALLTSHESKLMQCKSMESICQYIKTQMPSHMEDTKEQTAILSQAMAMPDLQEKLRLFEAEYELLHELRNRLIADEVHITELEDVREQMTRTNKLMVERLAICHGAIHSLQQQVRKLTQEMNKQQETIEKLLKVQDLTTTKS